MLNFVLWIEEYEFYPKKFKEKFEFIYKDLNLREQGSILYPFIFLMRRLLVVSVCHFDIMAVRVWLLCILQTAYLVYLTQIKPYKNSLNYKIELVNEIMFLIMLDLQPIFTKLIPDPALRYRLGWIFIAVYIGLFVFNLLIVLLPLLGRVKCFLKLKASSDNKYLTVKGKAKNCCKTC